MVPIDLHMYWTSRLMVAFSFLYRLVNDVTGGFGYQTEHLFSTYDYIVVGGGSSGCALAARLSEDLTATVLLLEAGPGRAAFSDPTSAVIMSHLSPENYRYTSQPQGFNCLAYKGGTCKLIRGKALGGSGNINAMNYVRGNRNDYDYWAGLGNYGWSYYDLLPYFRRMEHNTDPLYSSNYIYHGSSGPVKISSLPYLSRLGHAWIRAGEELGYPVRDINGEYQTGFTNQQGYYYKGTRSQAANSYLDPILGRPNLHLSVYSQVTKILISNGNRAYGVEVAKNNKMTRFAANREVILTAGALETTKLLLLSGIGPIEELHRHGIPVKQEAPVGVSMISNTAIIGITWTVQKPASYNVFSLFTNPIHILQYYIYGTGPLAAPSGFEGVAFINTKFQDPSIDWPDIQIFFISSTFAVDFGLIYDRNLIGFKDEIISLYRSLGMKESFSVIPQLTRPKSRGNIRLKSANPFHPPVVTLNFLDNPDDVKVLVEGIKFCLQIGNSTAFRKFGAKFHKVILPGCRHLPPWGDEYIECFIRHTTYSLNQDVGTAKMGPPYANWAVVDPELRVYGVKGLRVADISIMPDIITGNTNAAAMVIGEKASDLIKDFWNRPYQPWPDKIYAT